MGLNGKGRVLGAGEGAGRGGQRSSCVGRADTRGGGWGAVDKHFVPCSSPVNAGFLLQYTLYQRPDLVSESSERQIMKVGD